MQIRTHNNEITLFGDFTFKLDRNSIKYQYLTGIGFMKRSFMVHDFPSLDSSSQPCMKNYIDMEHGVKVLFGI